MDSIRIKRGLKAQLPRELPLGELAFCTDTRELYVGMGEGSPLRPVTNTEITEHLAEWKSKYQEVSDQFKTKYDGLEEEYATKLTNLKTQMSDLSNINFKPNHDSNLTIQQAYTDVSLDEVQQLNKDATLQDSADWFFLQKTLNNYNLGFYNSGSKRLYFPSGTYKLSRPLQIPRMGLGVLDFTGVTLTPFNNYNGYLIELIKRDRDTPSIVNLFIDGNYKSKGIRIDYSSFWTLDNVSVRRCYVGISIASSWYGDFLGSCCIKECITGILFECGDEEDPLCWEINTINFNNVSIGGATPSIIQDPLKFNLGSDTKSIGVNIQTRAYMPKLSGMTIEECDYGISFSDQQTSTNCFLNLENMYFENNRIHDIFQNTQQQSLDSVSIIQLNLSSSSFNSINDTFINVSMFYIRGTIENNRSNYPIKIHLKKGNNYTPCTLKTDVSPTQVLNEWVCGNSIVQYKTQLDTLVDVFAFSNDDMGYSTTIAPSKSSIKTVQDTQGYTMSSVLTDTKHHTITGTQDLTHYRQVISPFMFDLVLAEANTGIILKDYADKNYYKIYLKNGHLNVTREFNTLRITNPPNTKDISFFLNCKEPNLYSGKYCCYDLGVCYPIVYEGGKWKYTDYQNTTRLLIGTIQDIIKLESSTINDYSNFIYNSDINVPYRARNGYWAFGHPNMNGISCEKYKKTEDRAYGSTSQRPTLSKDDFFIYYDTSLNKYVEWTGSDWKDYEGGNN